MSKTSNTVHEIETTLRSVLQSLVDGQEGFQRIGDYLKDETLKRYFEAESLKRAEFRGELETVLHQEGIHDINDPAPRHCYARHNTQLCARSRFRYVRAASGYCAGI